MKNEEDQIHKCFFSILRLKMPRVAKYVFHIPNGGFRHIGTAVRLKQMGVMAGVADVFYMRPSKNYSGLWIEFKSSQGRQSEHQKEFENLAMEAGYKYCIARSPEQGIEEIKLYMKE